MNQKDILVIKVGTSTLTRLNECGERVIDPESFTRVGRQLVRLHSEGYGIIVVSSAAIASGMAQVRMTERPNKNTAMPELQRLASIGWRHILNSWSDVLGGLVVGELLLTKGELETGKKEGGELMRVVSALLLHGDIAIANENDAITHSEIAFGDNDTLAGYIAATIKRSSLFDQDVKLILLSDIDGVYADIRDPESVIATIDDIDAYRHVAGQSESLTGTGGMETKFMAASIALQAGVKVWIGNGRHASVIDDMLQRRRGTYFAPRTS